MNKYRSRLRIIRDILLVVASEKTSKKTHIMYRANLSSRLSTQYLDEILKAGLLMFDGESLYTITCRGKEFLKLYEAYEKNCDELEKQVNHLKDGREALKKMLS